MLEWRIFLKNTFYCPYLVNHLAGTEFIRSIQIFIKVMDLEIGNGTCHVRPSQQYQVVDLRMYENMTVRCLQARRDPVNYLSKIRYPN